MKSFLAAALFVLTTPALASETVYVEPATGSGTATADLSTATELIKSSVGDMNDHVVVDQPDKANVTLRPRLIKLGAAYILSLTELKDGKAVFASQLKAEHIEELDKVASRLTRSVLANEHAKEAPRVGEITDQEAHDGTQRRPARKATYIGLGASEFGNLNSSGVGYSFGLGYGWDLNTMMIRLLADFDLNGSAIFGDGTIGLTYFFDTRDLTPYLDAGFGLGAAKIDGGGVLDGQTVGGFVVTVGAGVQILRTAVVNLDLGVRASWLMRENELGTPAAYSLKLGVYF